MQGICLLPDQSTWVETAIMAKWVLHEAWLYCMEILETRLQDGQLSAEEKIKLDQMYTAFFYQAFYAPVKTKADFDKLVRNSRKMLSMLKKLDQDTWTRFILRS